MEQVGIEVTGGFDHAMRERRANKPKRAGTYIYTYPVESK